MTKDIEFIIADWPADPEGARVRKIVAADGLVFIQVRVDLGVLQMAMDGRPDGERPEDYETFFDFLRDRHRAQRRGRLAFDPEEWQALVREILQYYRRRVSLIALARQSELGGDPDDAAACYRRAIRDADHNLAILDFLRDCCELSEDMDSQEPYRPFILMQRTSCQARAALLNQDPDTAIEHIKAGVAAIHACVESEPAEEPGPDEEIADVRPFVKELRRLERHIRRKYHRRRTLREQLDDAIASEDFERAARLRDALEAREGPGE